MEKIFNLEIPNKLIAQASQSLKKLAANKTIKNDFQKDGALKDMLSIPASRYIVARTKECALEKSFILAAKGYEVGLEFVGEDIEEKSEIKHVMDEYLSLIDMIPLNGISKKTEINFDLSNLGLLISPSLASENASIIAAAAEKKNLSIMLSIERAPLVDDILSTFKNLAEQHSNIGITLQAYLHRTPDDLNSLIDLGSRIRLVKGVYAENPNIALQRSEELDSRYLRLLEKIILSKSSLACATHDPNLLNKIIQTGLLKDKGEVEMLHGVQPNILKTLKDSNIKSRVYCVYGENWFLHFIHRLSEAPGNLITAFADLYNPDGIKFGEDY